MRRHQKIIHLALALGIALVSALPGQAPATPSTPSPEPVKPETVKPKVAVESGTLVGSERDGVVSFQGIPFAAPPVGPLRWQPPRAPLAWTGERDATAPGPVCMQPLDRDEPDPAMKAPDGMKEDCLTLQVFAPKGAHGAPVMVWLHGGGNFMGSSSRPVYDGSAFARDGIVLVAANYRLGPFGFFAHKALTHAAASKEPLANYGLLDQIAALQWVSRNIAAFGGDPHNVTLFGESAGGQDVLLLMTVPATRGLFARALAESPASTWEAMPTLAAAETLGARLAGKLGVVDGTPEQLRAIPADRLLGAIAGNLPGPTIDGRLITQSVPKAFSGGSAAAVPLVIGTTSYEASLLEGESLPLDRVPAGVRAAYADDGVSGQALGDAIFTDHEFVAPVRWLARQATKHAAVWVYHFSYVRVSQRQKTPGAPHASELPFVFSSWDKMSARAALLPAEDRAMTALVHSCWVAFARGGTPVCQGAPAWPAYKVDGGNSDSLLEFGVEPEVRRHFRQKQLDAQDLAAAGHS